MKLTLAAIVLGCGALLLACRGADPFRGEIVGGTGGAGAAGAGGAGGLPSTSAGGAGGRGGAVSDAGADTPSDARPDQPSVDAVDSPPRASNGQACTTPAQCQSGFCVDGVCCDTACASPCTTCAATGHAGQCTAAAPGSDPRDDCQAQAPESCGNDGTCDGAGACRKQAASVTCKSAACTGSTLTFESRCDGKGACVGPDSLSCAPFLCGTDGKCRSTCLVDSECMSPHLCVDGSCGKQPVGKPCTIPDDCNSGHCEQGICCAAACNDVCLSCAVPGIEGLCAPVPSGFDPEDRCADDGAGSCGHDGFCDGLGGCRLYPAGSVCRPAAGGCDVAEACPGGGAACPGDRLLGAGATCRPAPSPCDVAELCDGSHADCPPDGLRAAGATCRPVAGACDVAEVCDGNSAACPPDQVLAAGVACRDSAGACDVAEQCSGSSPACPADQFVASGVVCRESAGVCDVAEVCSGAGPVCPADGFVAPGIVCRVSTQVCDAPEACTGGAAACPADTGAATPSPPADLVATPGGGRVMLTWSAVAGVTGYDVKRGTAAGGPYTSIAMPGTNSHTDVGLSNGTTYFYVVAATINGGMCESGNSAEASATPMGCRGVYCDDFEGDTVGAMAAGWTRSGGSSGDWSVVSDGSKVFRQGGSVSSTLRVCSVTGMSWSGATSMSAQVKLVATGSSNQAALVCVRFTSTSNFYCAAVLTSGVQIQTRVGGTAMNSAVFPAAIAMGTSYAVKIGVDAAGVLSAFLDGALMGSFTPPSALQSGTAAVGTTSMQASFDDVLVTQP